MNQRSISLQQFILYLIVVSAFSGTSVMSVEVGQIQIFPYRIFMIIMWLLFAVFIVLHKGVLDISHVKVQLYVQFLFIWLSYAFVSMMWAAEKVDAVKNVIFLFTGVSVIFFLVYYYQDLNRLKWLYRLWLLIFIALIAMGIWEVATGAHVGVFDVYVIDLPGDTEAGNPNTYATIIALSLPLVLAWIIYYPKLYSRVLGTLVYMAGLFLLLLTFSRACYIAVLTGLAFWFIFLLGLKEKIKALAVAAFISLVVMFVFSGEVRIMNDVFVSEIISLGDIQDPGAGNSIDIRKNLIKNALYFTAQSAGFGVGAGNAEYYMAKHAIYPLFGITNVHNWWIEILLNYGVLIFAGYILLYVTLILNLWRLHKRLVDVTEKMICEALLVGLVSFFSVGFGSSSIMSYPPQWIYLGFTLAFINYVRISESTRVSKCMF